MSFVDVGANWGYFTLLGAHLVGRRGRVISLEPDPRLFAILEANIARNDLGQVTPVPAAAADKPGTLVLAGYDEQGGNFGVSRILSEARGSQTNFAVTALSLDTLFAALKVNVIDLLKMDIEGAEGYALTGLAISLKNRRVQRLLLELHRAQLAEHGQSAREIIDLLLVAGYRGWTIDHSPRMNRRAAYCKRIEARSLLRPFDPEAALDDWPHLLWTVPGLEPLA
jgi:FkbM family methyltransferase